MNFRRVPDIMRDMRQPASPAVQYVQEFLQLGPVTVGTIVVPFSTFRIPAQLVFVQAAPTNTDRISVGGQNLSYLSGTILGAGQAAIFTVDPHNLRMLAEGVSASLLANVEVLQSMGMISGPEGGGMVTSAMRQSPVEVVILLNRLFAVANAANQTMSITYTQLVKT